MRLDRKTVTIALLLSATAAFPIGAAWYGSAVRGLNPLTAWACTTESRGGLRSVAGWDLTTEHTTCQVLVKHEAVSVYASPAQNSTRRYGLPARRTLLLRYDPGNEELILPTFEVKAPNRILISVAKVVSVSVQRHILGRTTVNYAIGPATNPDPSGLGQAH